MIEDEIYKCVRNTLDDGVVSYCGKNISGQSHFLEPTHAIVTQQTQGRLLICKNCQNKITQIMAEE